jgi:hypothetical protein
LFCIRAYCPLLQSSQIRNWWVLVFLKFANSWKGRMPCEPVPIYTKRLSGKPHPLSNDPWVVREHLGLFSLTPVLFCHIHGL